MEMMVEETGKLLENAGNCVASKMSHCCDVFEEEEDVDDNVMWTLEEVSS